MGLKGGVLVGAIGGLVGGGVNLIIELYWIHRYPKHIEAVPLTVNTVGGMIGVAIVAGILFGVSYAKLYSQLWGRGVIKGVYYGLLFLMYYIFLLIIINIIGELFVGVDWAEIYLGKSIWHFVLGRLPMWIACGITVGILYERIDRRDDMTGY